MDDHAGQQMGNYRLRHRIGRGGAADIYLGEHIHLETLAAIKVLHIQMGSNELDDFRREAKTIAHLLHPHIVRVLDFGVEGNTPFLVMDYAPRGTLRQCHPKGTRLPLSAIIPYIKQVASALQYAHDRKIIHRDVKPENMLLGINNQVLLSDFGISAIEQSPSMLIAHKISSSGPVGTTYYMAPEQIAGNPHFASDQYALGIVVYEWLCGARPFQGEALSVMYQHVHAPVPLLREKLPTLSPAIEHVVLRALAKDPQQRFATIWDFAEALEQASLAKEAPTLPAWPLAVPAQQTNASQESATLLPRPLAGQVALKPIAAQAQKELDSLPAGDTGDTIPTPPALQAGDHSSLHLRPYANNASGQSTQITKEPAFVLKPVSGMKPVYQHGNPLRGIHMMLLGLAIIIAVGSAAFLLSSLNNHSNATPATNISATAAARVHAQATASFRATATAAANAYNAATANEVMLGFNAQHTRVNPYEKVLNPTNVSQLVQAWKALTGGTIGSVPTVADGVVYVSASGVKTDASGVKKDEGNMYALDAGTGHVLWSTPTGSYYLGSGPTVAKGTVYIGSFDNLLYAFNASSCRGASCHPLWTATTGGRIGSSPTLVNGVIYIGSDDGKLYAFKASTGTKLWTASISIGKYIRSTPAVANGVVYVGSYDDKLYAVDATTGEVRWSVLTGKPIGSTPAVVNGIVYFGSNDDKLYAIDASTGAMRWTGRTGDGILSSPAVANGMVYVGSNDHNLYAFNASGCRSASCHPLWTATTKGKISSSPTVANGVIYVGSDDHNLYAFNASGCRSTFCQPLWFATTGGSINSSPTVANGFVYVGSDDKHLYAFHLPGTTP